MPVSFIARSVCLPWPSFVYLSIHPPTHVQCQNLLLAALHPSPRCYYLVSCLVHLRHTFKQYTAMQDQPFFKSLWIDQYKDTLTIYEVPRKQRA